LPSPRFHPTRHVLREIDVVVGRITPPLTCEGALAAVDEPRDVAQARRAGLRLRKRGRVVTLRNLEHGVRGVELTLLPEEGPVEVRDIRTTRRTKGFTVRWHQETPSSPVKVLLVSLDGQTIRKGRGPLLRVVRTAPGKRTRLRLKAARIGR